MRLASRIVMPTKAKADTDQGVVYVLINQFMQTWIEVRPGADADITRILQTLLKIGSTGIEDVTQRMRALYSTGVPGPFTCVYAAWVADYKKVEKALHKKYVACRVNMRREFFGMPPDEVVAYLKTIAIRDVTKQVEAAAQRVAKERPATRRKQMLLFAKAQQKKYDAKKRNASHRRAVGMKDAQLASDKPVCRNPALRFDYLGIPIGAHLNCRGHVLIVTGPRNQVTLNGRPMTLRRAIKQLFNPNYNFRQADFCKYGAQWLVAMYDAYWAKHNARKGRKVVAGAC